MELLAISVDCLLKIMHSLNEFRTALNIDWLKIWSCLMLLVKFIAINHDALITKSFNIIMTVRTASFLTKACKIVQLHTV